MDIYEVNFTAYEYYDTGGNSNISTMCDFNNSTIFQNEDENTLSLCYKNRSDFTTSLRKLVLLVSVA